MTTMRESTALAYREGGSDKVYNVQLEPVGDLWAVNFQYGRRGNTLTVGTKTAGGVDYPKAKRIYDELVYEKMGKGYKATGAASVMQAPIAKQDSGLRPQLLNPIGEDDVPYYLDSLSYCVQEKFDGKRIMVRKFDGTIHGINRKGRVVELPVEIADALIRVPFNFVIDGECLGDRYMAFDALEVAGVDYRHSGYSGRYSALILVTSGCGEAVKLAYTAWNKADKAALFARLKADGREGAVFKMSHAPWKEGRPNKGGTQLKCKFWSTLTAIVGSVNEQRSVALTLLAPYQTAPVGDTAEVVQIGNVTIPPNCDVPYEGDLVEVRYLYAYRGGCLYQPIYIGKRDDLDVSACVTDQLKFKAEEDDGN